MTIVAFHYTEESILAMTDGLISRGTARLIEENSKIVEILPRYKIPRVAMGRLQGFRDFVGSPIFIAYAGNFTLISNVLAQLSAVFSRRLVLGRDNNGVSTLYRRTDEGRGLRSGSYWDDYNFKDEELVQLSMNLIANIIAAVCEQSCLDFHRNAMSDPAIELLVFGEEIVDHRRTNRAQFMSCKEVKDSQAQLVRSSILPWRPFCFGERVSAKTLLESLEAMSEFDGPTLLEAKSRDAEGWGSRANEVAAIEAARHSRLQSAVFELIAKGTSTIGGSCTIAQSTWSQKLQVLTIDHDQVVRAVGG